MAKTKYFYRLLSKQSICFAIFASAIFGSPAFADEDTLRDLYDQAGKFADAMVADAETIRLNEDDYFYEKSEKYRVSLIKAQAAIQADVKNIRKIDNWLNKLSISLAENIADVGEAYSNVSSYKVRQDAANTNPAIRKVCDALQAEAQPTLAAMKAVVDSTHVYSDKQKEGVAPHVATLENKIMHYDLLIKNEMINYRVAAGKYDKRRERLGNYLWRFVHTYEDLNNKKELALVKSALVDATGLPGQSYHPIQEWVFHSTSIYTSSSECPIWIGVFPYHVSIPNHVDRLSNYITRPYEEFDEKKNFLPRPPKKGDNAFERVSNALSHRQVQLFNIEKAIGGVTTALSKQNPIVRDVLTAEDEMARSLQDIDRLIQAFRPEGEIQSELTEAERDLEAELDAVKRASKRVSDENYAIKDLIAADQNVRVKETMAGGFAKADADSRHKTVAEWTKDLKRQKALITDSRGREERVMSDTFWRSSQESQDARERLQTEIQRLIRIETEYDNKMEAVQAAGQSKPPDRTKLLAAEKAQTEARTRVEVLRKSVASLKKQRDARRTPGELIAERLNVLGDIDAQRASWKQSGNADVIAAVDKIDVNIGSRVSADDAVDGLSLLYRDLLSAHKALLEQVDGERAALVALMGRARVLDMKKRRVLDTLIGAKSAAVSVIEIKLSGAEDKETLDFLAGLKTYQKTLGEMKTALGQTSNILAKPETLIRHINTVNAAFGKNSGSVSIGELGASITSANQYVGQVISAADMLQSGVKKTSTLAKALTPPKDGTPAAGFAHIQDVLSFAGMGLESVPVLGSISGTYVLYMAGAVRSIAKDAEMIRAVTFNKAMHDGNYNPPERHLYTLEELKSTTSDHAVFLRWAKTGGNSVIEDLQVRRILFLLGARSINEACDAPLSKNSSDAAGKKTCTKQGAIQ